MSRLLDNDWAFILLFVVGFGIGVAFVLHWTFGLLLWFARKLGRLFRRRPRPTTGWIPPALPAGPSVFDELDALIDSLSRR